VWWSRSVAIDFMSRIRLPDIDCVLLVAVREAARVRRFSGSHSPSSSTTVLPFLILFLRRRRGWRRINTLRERAQDVRCFIYTVTTAASSVTVCLDAAARCLSCHRRRRCSRRRRRRRPIGFIINFALMNDDFFIMLLSNGRPYYAFNALPLYVCPHAYLTLRGRRVAYCLALRPSADPMCVCLSSVYLMYRVAQIKISQRLICDIYRQRTTPKFTRLKWPQQLGMLDLYQSRPKNISEYPMGLSRTISDIKGNLCINVPTPVYLTPR